MEVSSVQIYVKIEINSSNFINATAKTIDFPRGLQRNIL